MAFTAKDWRDWPDTTTPITAAALEDLETRLGTYADSVGGGGGSPFASLNLLSLSDLGAKSDGKQVVDAQIASGSFNLFSTQAAFTNADVGKAVLVNGAGAAGAPLRSKIDSVVSGHAVLHDAAQTTVAAPGGIAYHGTDDTAAWLAAYDSLATSHRGWKCILPLGISIVDGPFLAAAATTVGSPTGLIYRAQLPVPAVDGNITDPILFHFIGVAKLYRTIEASFSGTGLSSADIVRQPGSYVLSTRTDGTWDANFGWASMFAGPDLQVSQSLPGLPQTAGFSAAHLRLEDIGVITPDNPTLCAINTQMLASAQILGCHVEASGQKQAQTWPTHPAGQGIVMPSVDNFDGNSLRNCFVRGQYCAVKPGEHTRIDELVMFSNLCAIGLQTGIYPWTAGHIQAEGQNYVIADASPNVGVQLSGKSCLFDIQMLQLEDGSGAKAPVYHLWEGGAAKARIQYHRKTGVWITNGSCAHVRWRNLGFDPNGAIAGGGAIQEPSAAIDRIYFRAAASSSVGSIPATTTQEFFNNTGTRAQIDLTNKATVRLQANCTTATAGVELRVQYSTDAGSTWNYLDGGTGPAINLNATGLLKTGQVVLAAGAQADVLIRCIQVNTTAGALNPAVGLTFVEFS